MKFESVSTKLNIAISGVSLLSLVVGFFVLFSYTKQIENDVYTNTRQELVNDAKDKIASKMRVGITNAISIANDERIKIALENNKRELAIDSLKNLSGQMKQYTSFKNIKIHIHTKDNKSFLRNWKLDKYGDDLSSFRASVVSVNQNSQPIKTFEGGRAGLLLRAITPIIDDNNKPIGSLEFIQGINSVVKMFEKANQGFLLLMEINNINQKEDFSFNKDVKFKNYIISQKYINQDFLNDAKTIDINSLFKNKYILSSKYFYTYTIVHDFQNKEIGIILLGKSLSIVNNIIDKANELVYITLLGILGMIILISIVLVFTIKKLVINPLKEFENALMNFFLFLQGKQDYTNQIHINTDDEFGNMAKSLRENITVSAKLHEELHSLQSELEEKVQIRTQELAEKNREVQDSIEYASTIQRSFLKNISVIEQRLSDSFVVWQPRDKVGGDLYIYEESDEGIVFGVLDCTGHSVPGGFMTMLAGSMIKKLATEHFNNPAKLLSELNIAIKKQLNQDVKNSLSDDGLDIGLCFINKKGTILKFAGAKIDLLYFKDKKQYIVKSNKQSIGYNRSKTDYEYTNHEIHINSSESFYLYSDGITDQTGGDKNFPYGNKKFKTFLESIHEKSMAEQEKLILENLLDYQQNNTRRDDVTVIGFKIKKEKEI